MSLQVNQNNLYIFKTSISGDGTITNEKVEKLKDDGFIDADVDVDVDVEEKNNNEAHDQ